MTPGEFRDFLGIDTQRLRVWVEAGLLGDSHRKVERGNTRLFSRNDAVVGLVIREIMDLTKARSLKIAKEGLLSEIARALPEVLTFEGATIDSSTGKVNPTQWLILSWDRDRSDWHLSNQLNTGAGFPVRQINDGRPGLHLASERRPGQAVILIPLWELIEEVGRFLDNRR